MAIRNSERGEESIYKLVINLLDSSQRFKMT